MNRFRQASYASGIDFLESIPGLFKRLQIRALNALRQIAKLENIWTPRLNFSFKQF